jgi:hypothetical protein
MTTALHFLPKVRSAQIMASANGQPCSVRIASFIPGGKCSGPETTIGAHLPVFGKGVSSKVTDLAVAYCCFRCHQLIDRVDKVGADYIEENYPAASTMRMLNGLVETHARLIEQEILIVRDGVIV